MLLKKSKTTEMIYSDALLDFYVALEKFLTALKF